MYLGMIEPVADTGTTMSHRGAAAPEPLPQPPVRLRSATPLPEGAGQKRWAGDVRGHAVTPSVPWLSGPVRAEGDTGHARSCGFEQCVMCVIIVSGLYGALTCKENT